MRIVNKATSLSEVELGMMSVGEAAGLVGDKELLRLRGKECDGIRDDEEKYKEAERVLSSTFNEWGTVHEISVIGKSTGLLNDSALAMYPGAIRLCYRDSAMFDTNGSPTQDRVTVLVFGIRPLVEGCKYPGTLHD